MSRDAKIKVGMAFVDALNAHDLSGWLSALADDFTAEYPPSGSTKLNKEQAQMINQGFLVGFPDMNLVIDRVLVDGDYVAVYWTASGTHTGPMVTDNGEIPPTGRQATVPGVYTAEIRDGRVAREWTHWDQAAMLGQLGLMPTP